MDDQEENDKRRVMTPPEEWGGDDDGTDWLMASEEDSESTQHAKRPAIDDAGWLTSESEGAEVDANTESTEPKITTSGDWFSGGDITPSPEPSSPLEENNPSTQTASEAQPSSEPENATTSLADPSETLSANASSEFSSMDLLTDHHIVGTTTSGKLPLWPTIAGVSAVVLLLIGGLGAISERSSLQNRIVELESAPQSLGSLDAGDEAVLTAENQALTLQLTTLKGDYSAANETIQSLQIELDNAEKLAAQASRLAEVREAREPVSEQPIAAVTKPEPAAAVTSSDTSATDTPLPTQTSRSSSEGLWFANVAAYSRRATAEDWARKLQQEGYNAITQSVEIKGRTLYRVRAVGFETKQDAKIAAAELEGTYNLGTLWIGKTSAPPVSNLAPNVEDGAAASNTKPTTTPAPTADTASAADQTAGGWFIYVDTYAQGTDADNKAQQIEDAGYAAKVAVEYRSGELLYRVQIVGISSRAQGEEIIQALAASGDMPNLQLRQY